MPGNATPAAEANIHNDAEAADVVLGAGWDVTMVGLDVTHQALLTDAQIEEFARLPSRTAQHVSRILPFYQDFTRRNGLEGVYVHDSSAVAYVLRPELFGTRRVPVRVDTGDGLGRGKTWPDLAQPDHEHLPPWRDRPLVNVCLTVQDQSVVDLCLERV